jgi:hypothetical protein
MSPKVKQFHSPMGFVSTSVKDWQRWVCSLDHSLKELLLVAICSHGQRCRKLDLGVRMGTTQVMPVSTLNNFTLTTVSHQEIWQRAFE